ncbi:MAG: M16 family metallopeptidase [Propioniciclava sp.]
MINPRPPIAPATTWSLAPPDTRVLDNGLTVHSYHRPGQHVVAASLLVPVPLSAEPPEHEGVAALTAATLTEGTSTHPGIAFAQAVESSGAVLDAGIGYSHIEASLDVPRSRLHRAAPLFAEAIDTPQLADADVDRQRRIHQAHLEQALARGADRAQQALRHQLFDPSCREQRLAGGEVSTLTTVTGAQVRQYHRQHFGPDQGTLVVAGDTTEAGLESLLESFNSWTNGEQRVSTWQDPDPQPPSALIVDRPGSVQADLRWAWFTLDRQDPRWPAFQLGAHCLGGGFLSRMNRVLREERGYTYGVHLAQAPMRRGGFSYVHGSFRTDVVGPTLHLLPSLVDVKSTPLTDLEIAQARDYLLGVTPMKYATASGLCASVITLLAAGLDTDFINQQRHLWKDVTAAEATDAVASLLDPAAGTLVIVGDAAELEPQVTAAGWQPTIESS